MKKHFVHFLSPGTFFHEETSKEIESWNVSKAKALADDIVERYNSKPFAFYFTTRSRKNRDLDSKEIKRSGRYYLGGRVLTLEEVKRLMPNENVLISNMENNGWGRIVINTNSWKITQPLEEDDVVI